MKLLFCRKCQDVFKLHTITKTCHCGETSGKYFEDELNAEYEGPCIPLGFANSSLTQAIRNQPESGWGFNFDAFVIPKECPTMKKRK